MSTDHIGRYIDALAQAGVSTKTLAPLQETRAKFDEIEQLLATTYATDPLGDLLASVGAAEDVTTAAKQAAEHRAIAETMELYLLGSDRYEREAVVRWKTEDTMNTVLSEIGKKWDTANAYLAKIEQRWGSTNPSAEQLLTQATEGELVQWRGRSPHLATVNTIKQLFDHWLTTGSNASIPSCYRFINLESVRVMRTNPRLKFAPKIDWFLNDDGHIGTVQEAYKRVNEVMANEEKDYFLDRCRSVSPAPIFKGKYWITADAEHVRFNPDGTPEDASLIATHDEVMNLWKPKLFVSEAKQDGL